MARKKLTLEERQRQMKERKKVSLEKRQMEMKERKLASRKQRAKDKQLRDIESKLTKRDAKDLADEQAEIAALAARTDLKCPYCTEQPTTVDLRTGELLPCPECKSASEDRGIDLWDYAIERIFQLGLGNLLD